MAALTVTVHMRGRHRLIFQCRLARLLIHLHCYKAAMRVTRHIGLWVKVDAGKHSQWRWQTMYIDMTIQARGVGDG